MAFTYQTASQAKCSGRQTASFRANHYRILLLSHAGFFPESIQRTTRKLYFSEEEMYTVENPQ